MFLFVCLFGLWNSFVGLAMFLTGCKKSVETSQSQSWAKASLSQA